MALYEVELLNTKEECAEAAEMIVDRLRNQQRNEEEYLADVRRRLGNRTSRRLLAKKANERERALNELNGHAAAFIPLNQPPPNNKPPSANPELNSQFDDVPSKGNEGGGVNNKVCDVPGNDTSSSWTDALPTVDQVKNFSKETGLAFLKGAVVGVCVGVMSDQFRKLVCEKCDYNAAIVYLMQSAGLGGGIGAVGHCLLEGFKKIIALLGRPPIKGWQGVALVTAVFELILLIFKFKEKGVSWGFFRDCLGASTRVILITVISSYFSAVPAVALSLVAVKIIMSLQQNYEKMSRQNPNDGFFQLFRETMKATWSDFSCACLDWFDWFGSLAFSGTPTSKMKKILDEADESENKNQALDLIEDWDDVPDVFKCPLTLLIMQYPRFVHGRAFERDLIIEMAEKPQAVHPFTRQPMNRNDVICNEQFEKVLERYTILRLREDAMRKLVEDMPLPQICA